MSFGVHEDSWLAEVMDRPVFRVDGSGETSELTQHVARANAGTFYYVKVATDLVTDVSALTKLGFTVVDTNVTFELTREPTMPLAHTGISDLADVDSKAVLDIAGSAFKYSRFHLDPLVGDEVAHHVKREWIRNYVLRKRGDMLLVARRDDRVVGFLAPIVSHGTAIIDLVAVATDANGLGIGTALTSAFAQRYRGMRRIVGTQVANVPSIRLYTKLGFSLVRSQYVLHHHANC